jgi:hypothetical protein
VNGEEKSFMTLVPGAAKSRPVKRTQRAGPLVALLKSRGSVKEEITWGIIHNTLSSWQRVNGPNKLECYVTMKHYSPSMM